MCVFRDCRNEFEAGTVPSCTKKKEHSRSCDSFIATPYKIMQELRTKFSIVNLDIRWRRGPLWRSGHTIPDEEDAVSIGWIPDLVATGNSWQCLWPTSARSSRYTHRIFTTAGGHDLDLLWSSQGKCWSGYFVKTFRPVRSFLVRTLVFAKTLCSSGRWNRLRHWTGAARAGPLCGGRHYVCMSLIPIEGDSNKITTLLNLCG